ncbi:MAG TPA: 3-deoxy-D-manno-octulosonic acid kinase [Burkholderiales bacterium]|nr:3-deoxy-D-manno-octulosonic acid kinase [Burkholderiales bacterium]
MSSVIIKSDGAAILYDPNVLGKIESSFFDPAFWRARDALTGSARGRGAAWFVRHEGRELVLRHYRRGGLIAPLLGDRYLWTGLARTRAMREWHMLDELARCGFPVPRPVAARVRRHGIYYRADLLTERIPDAESLAQTLARTPFAAPQWRAIGQCLRRFHAANVWHADLNAHNILLAHAQVYVIDFDRGRLDAPSAHLARNIDRLKRSLDKLAGQQPGFHFTADDWAELLAGYADSAVGTAHI